MDKTNNYCQGFYPVVTGSNGDIKIDYRTGRREKINEGEDISIPVEARPTLCGHDIFVNGRHISSVTEKDFKKVAVGPLDYYVRRCLSEQISN